MKRVLPVLMIWLVASCGSLDNGSVGKDQAAAQDEKYSQALEYYTLTHEQEADPDRSAGGRPRNKPAAEIDAQTAKRMLSLQEAMRAWRIEKPDTRVAHKDREAVEQLVERVFQDPLSRGRMVIKTYDLKHCEKISYRFFNKNRGLVNVMFYNRGPMIQAGLDLYVLKHNDRWEIVYRVDWIG